MVIPRENKLVRLYIQITTTEADGSPIDRKNITPEKILQSAQKTLAPYKLNYEYCDWWTAYQIGQRVGSNFSKNERIFLAGDAVHTHSPKAGQGMNVSMQDSKLRIPTTVSILTISSVQPRMEDLLGSEWYQRTLNPQDLPIRASTHCPGSY